MTERGKLNPPKSKATPPDLIVPVTLTCPCGCKNTFTRFVAVLVRPELVYERDEITGQVKLDLEGRPIEKIRVSHEYKQVPQMHPEWSEEMSDHYKILYDRAQAEREFIAKAHAEYEKKHPKPEILAEVAA